MGLPVILVGVLMIIYGIYTAFSFPQEAARVPDIVGKGFYYTLIGGVLLIEGVVIQGFKKIYALILHLAAAVPYFLAIQEILRVGNSIGTQPQQYLAAAQYYLLAGIILNILGIVANNIRRAPRMVTTTTTLR